jgi:transposase-like protein
MEQRLELLRLHNDGESIASLAEGYGVSRKTIYNSWRNRSASARCWNPATISSAYRTTIISPEA